MTPPPQTSIPPAAHVLGTIGTVYVAIDYAISELADHRWQMLVCSGVLALNTHHYAAHYIKIIPQIWHNWRRKSTEGLPGLMLMLWSVCAVPFGVYAIVQNFNFALKLQPQCFGGLTLITWGQSLHYHNKWKAWSSTLMTLAMAIAFAATEAILIVTLRGPYKRGVDWPMTMTAITASVLLGLGLIPPYFELAKRNGRVIGINFIFLAVDYAGAVFSLLALVAQHTFDVLGGTIYIVTIFLETGIVASHVIWRFRVRQIRHEAKACGKTYDEFIAQHPSKDPWPTASTTEHDIERDQPPSASRF
ncbi:hypothetical protein M011DRAFT_480875 [Sporormia fimetaria CBS 119925]|uniref:PQ-loop-domain-containing protein n=1 Tax=Sporormia fimetaria CBS 119925 TaxID=1340428 RepID=A0A6A6UZX3_9PLEO|nr:hypothetical protein M011DRAFT_480875 [Sporormia fimetaria CBS 119925]